MTFPFAICYSTFSGGTMGSRQPEATTRMDSEAPQQASQLTGSARPVLLRIEQPALRGSELQERCKCAMAAGFDGVELVLGADMLSNGRPFQPAAHESDNLVEHDLKIRAVAARFVTTDVEVAAVELAELLRRAAIRGAQCLNLTIPPIRTATMGKRRRGGDEETTGQRDGGAEKPNAIERGADGQGFTSYQEGINFAYQLLRRVRLDAECCGVSVALEAGATGCLLSPVELRELIDTANSWAVGVCIDAARIALPADWIRILKARVHAVRVRMQNGECGIMKQSPTIRHSPFPIRHSPLDQAGNVQAICEALSEIRYDGLIIASGADGPDEIRSWLEPIARPTQ